MIFKFVCCVCLGGAADPLDGARIADSQRFYPEIGRVEFRHSRLGDHHSR